MCSGVKGIFTAHGGSMDEVMKNADLNKLIRENLIEKVIQGQGKPALIYVKNFYGALSKGKVL